MIDGIVTNEAQEFDLQFRRHILGINTAIPGVIVSFDGELATVQPAIKMQTAIDGAVQFIDLPVIVNVPVVLPFSQSLGLAITFPILPGDECLLIFSQRAIDNFVQFGGIQPPLITENQATAKGRHHDLTDAICIPGMVTSAHQIDSYSQDAVEIRDRERTTVLSVRPGEISMQALKVSVMGSLTVEGTITGATVQNAAGKQL